LLRKQRKTLGGYFLPHPVSGPDLAGGRPGASWWEVSAQLLHN